MNIYKNGVTIIMSIIISLLTFYSSIMGILDKDIYNEVYKAGTIHHDNIWALLLKTSYLYHLV